MKPNGKSANYTKWSVWLWRLWPRPTSHKYHY